MKINENHRSNEKNGIHVTYIKSLNGISIKGFESIRLGDLLYSELWYMLNKSNDQIEEDIKVLLNKRCFSTEYKKGKNHRFLLLSYYRGRPDRDNYWKQIVSFFPEASELVAHDLRNAKGSGNDLSSFERYENQILFTRYQEELRIIDRDLYRRYLSAFLVFQKRWLTHIKKRLTNKKVLLCYFDGGLFENIVVQAAKKAMIITISCQHGQPIFRTKEFDLINQAQILNFKSDFFIAANLHTVKQFEAADIDTRRIKRIGCFKNVYEFTEDHLAQRSGLCLFLDSSSLPFAHDSNKEMIQFVQDFASRINCQVSIKPHPSNDIHEINDICGDKGLTVFSPTEALDRCLEHIRIAICHASSVYFDLTERGIKTFIWQSEDYYYPITDLCDNNVFSVDEFISKLREWEALTPRDKLEIIGNDRNHVLNVVKAKERFVSFVEELLDIHIA